MRLRMISPSIKRIGCFVVTALLLLESVFFPIQAAAGERTLYYHNDAVGSPVVMTDSSGNVIWRADYEPFGDEWTLNETVPNSHRFTGKEVDLETDLHYFGARHYDADLARFVSIDPALLNGQPASAIRIPQRLNFYAYSTNNPYRYVDPDGRFVETAFDIVSLGISISAFYEAPSLINAAALAYDAISTAVPFLPGGAGVAVKGARIAAEVRYAQKGVSSTFRHGEFAGKTIEVVATGLKSGTIKAEQLPIKIIEREGVTYTLNNRSLMALKQAGVEPTVIQSVTGVAKYEAQLTQRITELGGKVDPNFTPIIRKSQ